MTAPSLTQTQPPYPLAIESVRGLVTATPTTLAALDDTPYTSGKACWVTCWLCDCVLDKTSTATADGSTVVNSYSSNSGASAGRWLRRSATSSLKWQSQTTWYVNASTGDDTYDGTSATFTSGLTGPVKHREEIYRRLGPSWVLLNLSITEQGTTYTTVHQTPLYGAGDGYTTWYIDPANSTGLALDTNDGITSTTPKLTWTGLNDAIGIFLRRNTTVNCLSNAGDIKLTFFPAPRSDLTASTAALTIQGVPTALDTGSLSGATFFTSASNLPPRVTDGSAKMASNVGAPFAYKTASVSGKLIDGFVVKDAGAGLTYYGGNDTSPTAGTLAYTLWTLPTITTALIVAPGATVTLAFFATSALSSIAARCGTFAMSSCKGTLTSSASLVIASNAVNVTNCGFFSSDLSTVRNLTIGGTLNTAVTISGCCFFKVAPILSSPQVSYIVSTAYCEGGAMTISAPCSIAATGIYNTASVGLVCTSVNARVTASLSSQTILLLGSGNAGSGIIAKAGATLLFNGITVANLTTYCKLTGSTYGMTLSNDGTNYAPTLMPQTREFSVASTSATNTITLSSALAVSVGDQITYYGGTGSPGVYTVASASTGTTITTVQTIGASTGGTARVTFGSASLYTVAHLADTNFNGQAQSLDGSRFITT